MSNVEMGAAFAGNIAVQILTVPAVVLGAILLILLYKRLRENDNINTTLYLILIFATLIIAGVWISLICKSLFPLFNFGI